MGRRTGANGSSGRGNDGLTSETTESTPERERREQRARRQELFTFADSICSILDQCSPEEVTFVLNTVSTYFNSLEEGELFGEL